jgi:hypothetical protein
MSQLAPIGDQGQRYEIHMVTHDGEEMRAGWQDTKDGGLVAMLQKHPSCSEIKIIDRLDLDNAGPEIIVVKAKKKSAKKGRPGRNRRRRMGKGRK